MEHYSERVLYSKPNNRNNNYGLQRIKFDEKIFGKSFKLTKDEYHEETTISEEMDKCAKYSNNMCYI